MEKICNYTTVSIASVFFLLGSACTAPLDTADPKQSFTKIYNEGSFSSAITALDVVETTEGYLILSTKQVTDQQFPGVTLLAIDKEGKVAKQTDLDSIYVSAAKGMFRSGVNYRFLCMNGNTTQAYMTEVDNKGIFVSDAPLNVSYPLCIGLAANGSYLVQGYSQDSRATIFANYSTALTQNWRSEYNVLESVDEPIFAHLSNLGKKYPFSVGETASNYYFNGFRNFTFSLVFVNKASRAQTGVLNGYQYDGGLSSIVPLEGNTFALSRFYFGENYINPKATINPSTTAASKDIDGRKMLELEADAAVSLNRLTLNGKKVLVYASNTIDKQIVIYVYDESTGNLVNSKYFGLTVPCEFGAMTATEDGGLLLVGNAFVDGRFKRTCAFKLAKSQLEDLVK